MCAPYSRSTSRTAGTWETSPHGSQTLSETPLTLSAEGSPASPLVPPDDAAPKTIAAGSGRTSPEWFAFYDPVTLSWRTFQDSFLPEWATFLETWPASGSMRGGKAYRSQRLVPINNGTASGLLPTPQASDYWDRGNLNHPSVQRRIRLGKQVGLSMLFEKEPCPLCVEGMMGYPMGWTHLKPSGTPSDPPPLNGSSAKYKRGKNG